MKIGKGDKYVIIPPWAIIVGALVVDNVVCNICKVITVNKLSKK